MREDDLFQLSVEFSLLNATELRADLLKEVLRDVLHELWLILVDLFFEALRNRLAVLKGQGRFEMLRLVVAYLAEVFGREKSEIAMLLGVCQPTDDVGQRTFALALIANDCDQTGV